MACVFGSKAFAFKNVPQVGAARGTGDLRAPAIRIQAALNRAGYFVVEAGPAAAGVKFIFRPIKRSVAAPADIGSGFEKIIKFTAEGRLGALAFDYVSLFRSK